MSDRVSNQPVKYFRVVVLKSAFFVKSTRSMTESYLYRHRKDSIYQF